MALAYLLATSFWLATRPFGLVFLIPSPLRPATFTFSAGLTGLDHFVYFVYRGSQILKV
ncbi:hypothetical protein F4815DRAFT_479091 [Daldinia loculata]|nr:hypothetical protein F4815DRAFT_479091 [Daldinia loculata]